MCDNANENLVLYFNSIKLINYRNFDFLECQFSKKLNIFVGHNGQGKTNIVEAIFYSIRGESFRFSNNESLIKEGCTEASIHCQLNENNLNYFLQTELFFHRKRTLLNKKITNQNELRKKFGIVLFSPESLDCIKESSEHRRNLVDDLLITYDLNNLNTLNNFKKALKTRNKILKNYKLELETKKATQDLLEALEPTYLQLATDYTYLRLNAIKALLGEFNNSIRYISQNNDVDISVEYVISDMNFIEMSRLDIENQLLKRLKELNDAELSSGVSLVGPHKHDIKFLYNGKDSRIFCSQGQQRALILAFKIAQIVYHRKVHGVYPILILDDVLSELDQIKREALISFLHEINTQTFLTTTDLTLPKVFIGDELSIMHLKNGLLTKES